MPFADAALAHLYCSNVINLRTHLVRLTVALCIFITFQVVDKSASPTPTMAKDLIERPGEGPAAGAKIGRNGDHVPTHTLAAKRCLGLRV